jgi:hypothetical protein
MINFDRVIAVLIKVVAQYPSLTRLELKPLEYIKTRPLAIDYIKRTELKLKEYKSLVEIAEVQIGKSKRGEVTIINIILSNATSIF